MQVELARVEYWGSVQQWMERDSSNSEVPVALAIRPARPLLRRGQHQDDASAPGAPSRFPQRLRDDPPPPVACQRFPQRLHRDAVACAVPKAPSAS
jgi:hypothetical protein